MDSERLRPGLWPLLVLGILLALGDLCVFALAEIACAISENAQPSMFCVQDRGQFALTIPAFGAVVVSLSIVGARRWRRVWIFVFGAAVSIGAALYVIDRYLGWPS